MFENFSGVVSKIRNSITLKIVLIAFIILVLQVPVLMVYGLIADRQRSQNTAISDVTSKWGKTQLVSGPYMIFPAVRKIDEKKKENTAVYLLPSTLKIQGEVTPQIRYRGIYQVVLYSAELKITGRFDYDFPAAAPDNPEKIFLNDAVFALGISDIIGIRKYTVKINGTEVAPRSGIPDRRIAESGIHIPLPLTASKGEIEFEISILLNGSTGLEFLPLGQQTSVQLGSSWADPSFCGSILPTNHYIARNEFRAEWNTTSLNRNYPQQWIGSAYSTKNSSFGVEFKLLTSLYTQVHRAINYAALFMVFIMMAYLIGERAAKVWMHPLQYFLCGCAIVLFYSILLSVGEHLPFHWAYAIAAVSVTLLTAFYCKAIFRKNKVAVCEGIAMFFAYGIIFLLLKLETYALLVGSAVLFVLLAVLMAVTANVNKEKAP
ncbi:MAG: Inner membrane protein CreD [Lentisphaerae bacterium ADurb.Bin242]|nr:MAG: Inner membrane protein CreD [Lentisphaerae bacterium ADurb.Bin242]